MCIFRLLFKICIKVKICISQSYKLLDPFVCRKYYKRPIHILCKKVSRFFIFIMKMYVCFYCYPTYWFCYPCFNMHYNSTVLLLGWNIFSFKLISVDTLLLYDSLYFCVFFAAYIWAIQTLDGLIVLFITTMTNNQQIDKIEFLKYE